MHFTKKYIKRIMEKYKKDFEILENYDKKRELPFQRKRIDVTLSIETINRLKGLREKTGKPISRLIEENLKIWNYLHIRTNIRIIIRIKIPNINPIVQ